MENLDKIKEEIKEFDELLKITKKTKEEAISAEATSKAMVDNSIKILSKYGISPENANEELEKIQSRIEQIKDEIKDSIPYETLRKLKRID